VIGLISLSMTIISIIRLIQEGGQPDWVGMIIKGVIVWLLLAGYGLWNTISSIIDGVGVLTKPEHEPKSKIDRLAAKWAKYRSADSIELP
jgi:Na+/H+ antiporter NhaA